MRVVVKLGGSLLTDLELLHRMVAQLAAVQDAGHEVIAVHGGGMQIKETLERLAIPSRFHHGLRVTDAPTMRVVQMVLAGWVNKEIVASFQQLGRKAVGLCGGDGGSFVARKFQPSDGEPFDYGYVGEVFQSDPKLVQLLLSEGYFPVIACTAMGSDGAYYNINADEMAAAAAIFCRAERLVFLTDVPGVLDGQRAVIPQLNCHQITELRSAGVISEGMLPKTRACERALAEGIQAIHVVGGKEPDCLSRVLLKNEALGTEIV
ncbi:MAG: acetylglutamate kinase [Acidobacteria bacterium]|nr:acetylglutamate kinase [Acidobacteriota bacterium]MCI0625391.1 acetylglutamate kinase [Acidobacteriota bacterium]MCI0721034.1 acetylglutamate kinase [Acidobacteriota bacterium]